MKSKRLLFLTSLGSAVFTVGFTQAADITWIGITAGTNTNNNDWNVAANWSTTDIPDTLSEVAVFDGLQTNILAAPWLRQVDTSSATINGLTFNSGVTNFNGNSGNTANVNFTGNQAFVLGNTGSPQLTLNGTAPTLTQSGAGAITVSASLMLNSAPSLTLGGNGGGLVTLDRVSGSNTITKTGNSSYAFTGTTSPGATTKFIITGGQLRAASEGILSTVPTSVVADYLVLNGGQFRMSATNNQSWNVNRGITLGSASGSGTGTIGYSASGAGTFSINSIVADNGTGADNLVVIGAGGRGVVSFGAANTYTGTTEAKNSIIQGDFSTLSSGSRFSDSAAVTLTGGRLAVKGHATNSNTETIGGLKVGNGLNTVNVFGVGTTTLALGAITRDSSYNGVVGFQKQTTGVNGFTTTTSNTSGIIGGWATYGTATISDALGDYTPTDWAANDGFGNVVAFTGYTANSVASGVNANITTTTTASSSGNINSLRIAGGALSINSGVTLTIDSGGILHTTNNAIGNVVGQGTITSGNGKDLIVHSGAVSGTINSVIADNGGTSIGLTIAKWGSSQAETLTANNTFTGAVNIYGGILEIGTAATADVGDGTAINIGLAGHGGSTGAAQLRFASAQLGDKTLSQNITITAQHALADSAIKTAAGSFGGNNFDLNLDGNIALETVTAQADAANILVLEHLRSTNSSVRIGGASANAKTITGSSVVGQHSVAVFNTNNIGFQNNTLAGGITDMTDALTINSKIQDGTGGALSLQFEATATAATGGLGLVVLNGTNTFTGAGAANFGGQSGTTVTNNIILAGNTSALGTGPLTMGRITGGSPFGAKQGLLTNGAYTIANNIGLNALTQGSQSAANGITAYESWVGGNTANTSTFSGRIDWMTPNGVPVTNTAYITGGNPTVSTHSLVLSQVAGGRSNFTGVIATNNATGSVASASLSPVIVASGGQIGLSNTNNSYVGQTIVRNGTLLVGANAPSGANGALGNSTSAIQLGDTRAAATASTTVKSATVGVLPGTVTFNTGGGTNGNGILTWTAGFSATDNAWDGQALAVNDYVLIKDQTGGSTGAGGGGVAVSNPAVNGIYKVLNIGATTAQFERVGTADSSYGTYVNVSAGNVWGGKRFYQGYGGTGTAVTINNTPQSWMVDDTTYAPTLLADGAVTIGRDINVNAGAIGTSTLGGGTNHNSTFSGGITLGKNLSVTSVATGANKTTLSGVINDGAGSFGITKTGAGRLEVTNANTYDGGTTVSLGTLLVNNTTGSGTGTGTVGVDSGATLGGTGVISGAVNVTGVLAPGASIESLGSGTLTFNSGSTYAYEINTSTVGADLQFVTGDLNINGTVTLNLTDLAALSQVLTLGTKFTLISYTGAWDGDVFNGYADDGEFTFASNDWRINYNDTTGGSNFSGDQTGAAGFVTITVIPEPRAALLGGLGLLVLLRRRRA